jgi:hypothetical protein
MALITIPLRNDIPDYEFKVDLDGTTYTLTIRYNTRLATWIMDLKTEQDESIVLGVPLLLGTILLERFPDSRVPPGDLFLINIEDETAEATRDNLGENVLLL